MAEAGIEPNGDFDAIGNLPCDCVICGECRDANALLLGCSNWRDLSLHGQTVLVESGASNSLTALH
jgi:hypothetical protein